MSLLVLILGISGTMLISLSIYGLRGTPKPTTKDIGIIGCGALAPDDSITCSQEIAHNGWHRNGETAWFGDAWDVDQYAETQQRIQIDPDPTMSASDWKTREDPPIFWGKWRPKSHWRTPSNPNWQFYYDVNPYIPPKPETNNIKPELKKRWKFSRQPAKKLHHGVPWAGATNANSNVSWATPSQSEVK